MNHDCPLVGIVEAFVFDCQNPPLLGLTFLGVWVALGVYWIDFPWSVQQPFFQLRIRLTGRWMKFPVWMEFDKEERRSGFDKSAWQICGFLAESFKNQGFCPVVSLVICSTWISRLGCWMCLGLYIIPYGSNRTLWKMRVCFVFGCGWSKKK